MTEFFNAIFVAGAVSFWIGYLFLMGCILVVAARAFVCIEDWLSRHCK